MQHMRARRPWRTTLAVPVATDERESVIPTESLDYNTVYNSLHFLHQRRASENKQRILGYVIASLYTLLMPVLPPDGLPIRGCPRMLPAPVAGSVISCHSWPCLPCVDQLILCCAA